ncbi:MAG: L-threonylcarbamoyladenylate synthase [Bacteroidales bacterium]|nr:L-threonylcarbamoyladenylate synthase [Bacteroidales bacterium]
MIDNEVQRAGDIILSGGVILYPTDTIWGIGCDARNRESIRRIYQIKQRADSKSMLVLVDDISMLEEYLAGIPLRALRILEEAKKPTTIIYPGSRHLADNLLAPDGSVGIRITSDPFCLKLIEKTGLPIVSTSANLSGDPSPAVFHQIKSSIREQVDHIVNWRQNENTPSQPSAIIKLEEDGSITTIRD